MDSFLSIIITLIVFSSSTVANDPSTEVYYHLYTSLNPIQSHILDINQLETFETSHFNHAHPTKILIHGWTEHYQKPSMQEIKDAYMKKGNINVIIVDWSLGARHIWYPTAKRNVKPTAKRVSKFLRTLTNVTNTAYDSINLIGFSLGAHMAGFIGKKLGANTLPAIVAIDPPQLLYDIGNPNERVHFTDAKYVEVIHTSSMVVSFHQHIGDADFMMNYGYIQPQCQGVWIKRLKMCSHLTGCKYFAESITSSIGFYGKQCTDSRCRKLIGGEKIMGGEPLTPTKRRAIYLAMTNRKPPFACGRRVCKN